MALYFKTIVDAFINGVIMPIVSAIVGEENFDDIDFGIGDATLEIGLVIQAIIMFLVVAFVLFLIIKAYNTYIAKPAEEATTDTELSLLTEIRDELPHALTRLPGRPGQPAGSVGAQPPL